MKQTMTQHGASVAWISALPRSVKDHSVTQTEPGQNEANRVNQDCQLESIAAQRDTSDIWISVVLKSPNGHTVTQADPGKVGSTWNTQVCQIVSMAKQINIDATPFNSNRLSGQIVSHDVMTLTLVDLLLSQEPSHWEQGVNALREIPVQFINRRM